jgi:hypothetical protein
LREIFWCEDAPNWYCLFCRKLPGMQDGSGVASAVHYAQLMLKAQALFEQLSKSSQFGL